MKFDNDMHPADRMNPDKFGDPPAFRLLPPACHIFIYLMKYLNIYELDLVKMFTVPR